MGTVGVAHDVTNLATMSAELELLLGSLPFAVMITDAEITSSISTKNSRNRGGRQRGAGRRLPGMAGKCHVRRPAGPGGRARGTALETQRPGDCPGCPGTGYSGCFSNRIGAIVIFRDVTLEREFERRLSRHANTDVLTGLYNRRYFYEHAQPGGTNGAESLLYVDLDHFKSVNDRWGHQAGDQALVTVAELLRASCPQAVVARLGGDEFALYWGDRPLDFLIRKARLLVKLVREAFRSSEPCGSLPPASASCVATKPV